MREEATYLKTPKGTAEIQTRKNKLSVRQRNLLIMIDGSKALDVIHDMVVKIGLTPADLAQLEQEGFIERTRIDVPVIAAAPTQSADPADMPGASRAPPDEAAKFRTAHKFMNDTVVNSVGLKAFFFTLKLERCATRADLSGLLADYSKALIKATGANEAELMVAHARQLLE